MELELTETGFISILGMVMAFALACCRGIQQSRCNEINSPCMSCKRDVINEQTLLEMKKMEEGENPLSAQQVNKK